MICRTRFTAVSPNEARRAVTGAKRGVTGAAVQALACLLAVWTVSAFCASFLASVALVTRFAGATTIFGTAFQGVLLYTLTF